MVGEGSVKGGIDEALIALVGLGAAAWYWRCRHARSLLPLAFIGADVLLKVGALMIVAPASGETRGNWPGGRSWRGPGWCWWR